MSGINEATRLVSAIDQRIAKATKVGATVETTWGEIANVSADGRTASAYLRGEDVESYDFDVPAPLQVAAGDLVKVAWNARGERWIDRVKLQTDYPKVIINPGTGQILTGDGNSAPTDPVGGGSTTNFDPDHFDVDGDDVAILFSDGGTLTFGDSSDPVSLSRGGSNRLDLATGDSLRLVDGDIQFGSDVVVLSEVDGDEFSIDIDASTALLGLHSNEQAVYFRSWLNGSENRLDILVDDTVGIIAKKLFVNDGSGTASFELGSDVVMSRGEADVLSLGSDDRIRLHATSNDRGMDLLGSGILIYGDKDDANPVIQINATGALNFGAGGATAVDVSMSRGAANRLDLSSGDSLRIVDGELQINTDVVLSRGAANRLDLASGDSFRIVSGSLQLDTDVSISRGAANRLDLASGDSLRVPGFIAAGNIACGSVSITPVANTPTSGTVTGLGLTGGGTFRGLATAATAVPGTQVTGVGVASETSDGMTVWVTRTNTTATGIRWMVVGETIGA